MELCSYRTSPNLLQFSPSILSYPLSNSLSLSKSLLHPTLKNNSCSSSRLLRPISLIKRPSAAPATSPSNHTVLEKLPADIRVTETPQPNSTVKLRVEVPPAVCEDCYKRVLNEFMKQAKVPGFRPGKNVPESILIGFVGEQSVQKATIESILKRTLPHAMESVGGRALKDSIRIVTHFSEMEKAYSSQNSLSYDVVVDVAPEVKWVPEGGYTNLVIKVEMDNDIDAHMASERELRRRHKSLGSIRIVIDRGLQVGDVAVLDISATTVDQDELNIQKIPSAESKGFHFDTEDSDNILPGFLDLIIGIQRGETKSFQLAFPDSWKQEHLRGVNAQFTVVCTELFYRDMPELNDSISDKLLQGCTTLEEVKESLTQRFIEIEKTAKEQATDNAILDQICKMIEVDIPRSLFEEQGRGFYGSKLLQIQAQMKLNEQQLASLSSPKSVNEYLESQRKDIMNVIKQNLAVGDIFKRENLQFSTEELAKEVENSIAEFKSHNQEYDEERVKEQVQEILEGAKVLEWLREHSVIEYTTR